MIGQKLQPQALDLEIAVLGGLMMDAEAYDKASQFLKEEVFYLPNHRLIFKAIEDLHTLNQPVDILTVANKMKANGTLGIVGGPSKVSDLTSGIGSAGNIVSHAMILYEKYLKRELIRLSEEMHMAAYDDEADVFDTISKYQNTLDKLVQFNNTDFSPSRRTRAAREHIYKAKDSPTGLSGVSSGYDSIDRFTGGFQGGDLIIMAGFPGTGKSALTLAIEHNAATSGMPTMMFEQEMSDRQVGIREIALHTQISIEDLKIGNVNDEQLKKVEQAIGVIDRKKVFMDLSSGIKINRFKSIMRKMVKEHGVGLGVLDYLGLCDLEDKKHGGREQAIDNFLRECKNLAKELDIPIIVLAQFVKVDNSEKLKIPHAGLLKGSSAIEAHADVVGLLWNPAAIDPNFEYDFYDGNGPFRTYGLLGIQWEKNRQGRNGLQWIRSKYETNTFSDYGT